MRSVLEVGFLTAIPYARTAIAMVAVGRLSGGVAGVNFLVPAGVRGAD